MYKPDQEFQAGRIQPAQFDTVLPPDARAEFFRPKRPVILQRPLHQPPDCSGTLKWAGGIGLVVIILAGLISHYSQSLKTPVTTKQSTPAIQPTPAPQKPVSEPRVKPEPVIQPPLVGTKSREKYPRSRCSSAYHQRSSRSSATASASLIVSRASEDDSSSVVSPRLGKPFYERLGEGLD